MFSSLQNFLLDRFATKKTPAHTDSDADPDPDLKNKNRIRIQIQIRIRIQDKYAMTKNKFVLKFGLFSAEI